MLSPPPFPIAIDQLTNEVLSQALDAPVAGFTATRVGAERGMLGEIFLLDVQYRPGGSGPATVAAKFAALRDGSLASARRGGTHERELRCYDELLRTTPVNSPRLYRAWHDPDTAHFLLIQDAVAADDGIDQIDGLDLNQAELVLTEVARCHAAWWGEPSLADKSWLPRLDAEQRRHNLAALTSAGWDPLCQLLGEQLSDEERALGAELPDRIDSMLCDLADLPSTLVHGDLRTDNLLFTEDHAAVWLIDWQGAGVGPAGWDLAYFLTQCLSVEDRRANEGALLDFYRRQLTQSGGRAGVDAGLDVVVDADVDAVAGFERSILFGLAIACALPLISDPGQPRVATLAATVARRTIEALRDHDQLW